MFQRKLADGLKRRGVDVTYDLDDAPYDAVLVIMLTRHLGALLKAKARGVRIVQRLDGVLWRQRAEHWPFRARMEQEMRNGIMRLIRRRVADHVVYQSRFIQECWDSAYGRTRTPSSVIHNGTSLDRFQPAGPAEQRSAGLRAIAVEGTWAEHEVSVVERLAAQLDATHGPVEIWLCGNLAPELQRHTWRAPVRYLGPVANDDLARYERSADVFLSCEVNPPCPNAVVEALACGLPVVGFDTGALAELVGDGGLCVPYGGDPWALDVPDVVGLAGAVSEAVRDRERLAQRARTRAETHFDVEVMIDRYLELLRQ